ncbi:MAG: hypothetical protein ABJA37_06790 [Ferruginibacter sp.]
MEYIPYKNIDKNKWDTCIKNAINGLIYAQSFYLDNIAENWDALVLNDYEAIMPLTWKKKWGIKYLYQPSFIQQGGVFSKEKISPKTLQLFIEAAYAKFGFAEFTLNYLNKPGEDKMLGEILMRNNFIRQLGSGYENIFNSYSPYIKQHLTRLFKFSMQYRHYDNYKEVITLYKKLYHERMPSVYDKDFVQLEKICKALQQNNRLIIRNIYAIDGEELLAAAVILKDDKRLYNIVSCIMPRGKKLLANYFLYDELIKEFADENIILDFEGSDIEGVAYFYNKFSESNQQYPFIKFNRLPLPFKLFKK